MPALRCGFFSAALFLLILSNCSRDPYGCKTTMTLDSNGVGVVDPRFRLHDTGIDIVAGDLLTITAEGEVCAERNSDICSSPVSDLGVTYGLWAQVGDNDTPFYVGDNYRRIAPAGSDGRLYMVIPDGDKVETCDEESHYDNSGSFTVTITVEHL